MRFTIISKTIQNDALILDSIKGLVGNVQIVEDENYFVVYHDFKDDSILNGLFSDLSSELFVKITAYNSYDLNQMRLNKELNIASYIFNELPMGYYNLKSALAFSKYIENKSYVLDFILEGTGVTPGLIEAMASADLNVSKASKISYLHRNTILYKLDKLYNDMNFDLRCFKDEFILYSLIERKAD